ncbi:MAG: hypothetical protein ACKO96_11000 [Flammeovirgaceae bacterium]
MNFKELLGAFRQGKASAKSHMKNLIEMAMVDGNFNPVEYDLLRSIAKRNNISELQLMEIKKDPLSANFEVPTDPKEKFQQLYDLIHMMTIDKSIHEEELKLSSIFAMKFGYKRELIDELVSTIKSNIENGQNSDEAMKRSSRLLV